MAAKTRNTISRLFNGFVGIEMIPRARIKRRTILMARKMIAMISRTPAPFSLEQSEPLGHLKSVPSEAKPQPGADTLIMVNSRDRAVRPAAMRRWSVLLCMIIQDEGTQIKLTDLFANMAMSFFKLSFK